MVSVNFATKDQVSRNRTPSKWLEEKKKKKTKERLTYFSWISFHSLGYRPAIFYANEYEREIADRIQSKILDENNWDNENVQVPNLERPKFWTAEKYHQDYHIENRNTYAYYKSRCGRTNRLKEVWGEEEYYCYHDMSLGCFNGTVLNEDGELVNAEVNFKNAPEEKKNPHLPIKILLLTVFLSLVFGLVICSMLTPLICACVQRWKGGSAAIEKG